MNIVHTLCNRSQFVPHGFIHCGFLLGNMQSMHIFTVCRNLQKELVIGLNMQQIHHLGCYFTESVNTFAHQGTNVLINSIGTAIKELNIYDLLAIWKYPLTPLHPYLQRTGTWMASTPCMYEVQANEILVIPHVQLVMIPIMHLKNEIEPDHIPVTSVNLLNDPVQLLQYIPIGSLQLYTEHQDEQNNFDIEINQTITEKEKDTSPCTPQDAKFLCSPAKVDAHRELKLESTTLCPITQYKINFVINTRISVYCIKVT